MDSLPHINPISCPEIGFFVVPKNANSSAIFNEFSQPIEITINKAEENIV
jgi:hypothetical protein